MKKKNKFSAEKCFDLYGNEYDSKAERDRGNTLFRKQMEGSIKNLERQKTYVLIPTQTRDDGVTERKCSYIADFVYNEVPSGRLVVEDVKGYKDGAAYRLFCIKRKLMLAVHGISVKEIDVKKVKM